jgi:hypothetical protein
MLRKRMLLLLISVLAPLASTATWGQTPSVQSLPHSEKGPSLVAASEINSIIPPTVFFSGRLASVQIRNAAAVRFEDNSTFFAALVDSSGYSSGLREKYQFYLVTETPVSIAGKRLDTGTYGGGFTADGSIVLMDIGGHDVLVASITRDEAMKRPRPLQIIEGSKPGEFRLALGRQYVSFRALPRSASR